MSFATDTFTGTEGTELHAYSADWTKVTGATGSMEIASNRVRASSTTSAMYYHSATPPSTDYTVSCTVRCLTGGGGSNAIGVLGRCSTGAVTAYHARANDAGGWQLYKIVSGSFTQLGSTSSQSYVGDTDYALTLKMVGTTIELYALGGGSPLISVTDSAISQVGKAGLRTYSSSTPTDTNGFALDDFDAAEVGATGVTGTLDITESGDTFAASGTVGHVGTLAVTEAGDTFAATGTVTHTGTLAVTESADTFAASGVVGHVGTMAVTESGDVFEATGTVGASYPTGTMDITESPDTFAASGTVGHVGAIDITESGDTFAATGTVGHVGTMAITERGDTFEAIGTAGTAVYGRVPGRSRPTRRVLITINGARFLVPEDEVEQWLALHAEEEAEKVVSTAQKPKKIKTNRQKNAIVQLPVFAAKRQDDWVKRLVAEANRTVREQVELKRRIADEEDDELLMLLVA
jgi:hypothetical protein